VFLFLKGQKFRKFINQLLVLIFSPINTEMPLSNLYNSQTVENLKKGFKMNEIANWISPEAAYILVMKGGSQHCVITSSVKDDWIKGNAGIAKVVCLYEDESTKELKLMIENPEIIEYISKKNVVKFSQRCLVVGPEMIVRFDEVAIIEKSNADILPRDCFLDSGEPIASSVVSEIAGLQEFWSEKERFKDAGNEWRTI